jgi:CubicO group peptidase (beta-lactamase class C family)
MYTLQNSRSGKTFLRSRPYCIYGAVSPPTSYLYLYSMHRLYLLLLLATQTAMAQSPNPASAQPLSARLDSFFHAQPTGTPGFALSIEKNGEGIYRNACGLADLNTPLDSTSNFRMASVTKQFTAMGILLLERDGTLTLDDPIGRWLPELPAALGNRILIRHLLTHS